MTDLDESLRQRIETLLRKDRIVLFMKGSPSMPQCGFSAAVVEVLRREGVAFQSVNILADPELREGLKRYANWPTYPQLWVDGELVGGCDIVRELHGKGELTGILAGGGRDRPA